MTENFKRQRIRGWITSSDGFSIRVGSRTGIDYRDDSGSLRIDSEAMSGTKDLEVVVYSGSIPDTPERSRFEVLDRLHRAFQSQGWKLTEEDAWFD